MEVLFVQNMKYCVINGGIEMPNIKKTENTSIPSGMEQPLMSTGTTEAAFDWNPDEDKPVKKPMIGNTVVIEDE
ncbi:hypothetical protein [Neobacillus drentensis]|uniref:hypothetical protein n=1 Tax=Neobacillus drentensis TaxID=220684 RepID=UPI002FFEFBF4